MFARVRAEARQVYNGIFWRKANEFFHGRLAQEMMDE